MSANDIKDKVKNIAVNKRVFYAESFARVIKQISKTEDFLREHLASLCSR